MYWTVEFIRSIDWNSPLAVILIGLMTILAITRKWFMLAITLLVITLCRGLCYMQLNRQLIPDTSLTLAMVIYISGGIIVASLAALEFFVKE
jgi:hypothetical protein